MVEMKFDGLDELIRACEKIATGKQLEEIDREIIIDGSKLAKSEIKRRMHRSKDVSKSGRKGSRTGQHAIDNIPESNIKKKKDRLFMVIGWEKSDDSPYYYMKFEEWGTSKRTPHESFYPASQIVYKNLNAIGIQKYETLLKKVLEG